MSANININASESTVQSVLSRNVRFKVPEYQRQYSWTEEQWEAFWRDLTAIEDEETHFIGSLVLIERDTAFDEMDVIEIVDGQQRLTTISILLCMMRERYNEEGKSELADRIEKMYLKARDSSMEEHQNLTLGQFDNEEYRRLLRGQLPRNEESQLRGAAEFFAERLDNLTVSEMNNLRTKLVKAMPLVTIECDTEDSAFRLFETLNDRGLELSAVDLMKNHLFQKTTQDPDVQHELVREDWQNILEDIRYGVDKPRRFFIHYIQFAPSPEVNDAITKNTLYKKFKQVVDEDIPKSSISVEDYIREMADQTVTYLEIINAEISQYDPQGNEKINDLLEDLQRLGVTQERILLLGIFNNLDTSNEVLRALEILESFVVRRRFTSSITGTKLNQLYAELCAEAFKQQDPVRYLRTRLKEEAPTDNEFRAAFEAEEFKRSDRTAFVLERLERDHFRTSRTVTPMSGEVEHVAPRKAYTAKKYSAWPTYLGVSEDDFNKAKNSLGNLTLLESRINAGVQNDPFDLKKRHYSDSEFQMSKEIAEIDDWSIDEIEARTEKMAELATETWNFEA